ncbi:helix-turn-helix transcriptional regulator [Celeribacter sp. HF31]|uniref:helix-turn-helix domain-containing protein n=1 Tax=Celeribacter sp. HF31 TaxID=2721558 RepID=UPI0014321C48|nr:helix-turn-helix transcriptional regulator [Celeribacter sp. HF31]NIY78972.1 helix-turn-helix transcriptional regulator [Celeribacter sp. HF31]
MAIEITLDMMLVKRKLSSREVAQAIGLSETNLSLFKSGKVKGVRFQSLDALCKVLDCQPGDILRYVPDDEGA